MATPVPALDARDFEGFVADHQVGLRRSALALTGNGADADDLLQSTLVKGYLAWSRLDDRDNLGAYARTTMSRTYVSLWRAWGRGEVASAAVPETAAPEASGIAERDLIWRGLRDLGRRQRAIVVLRFYEDLDHAAIASTLGIRVRRHRRTALAATALVAVAGGAWGVASRPRPTTQPSASEAPNTPREWTGA